jgi:hypothetical protein
MHRYFEELYSFILQGEAAEEERPKDEDYDSSKRR